MSLTPLTRFDTLIYMTTEQEVTPTPTFKPINPIDLNGIERAVRALRAYPDDQESVEFWTKALRDWAGKVLE